MKNIKFRNQFDDRERTYNKSGDFIENVYSVHTDKLGNKTLKKCGTKNQYKFIQGFANSQDINYILERVKQGETNLLNINPGVFTDLLHMPKDLLEANLMVKNAMSSFNSLPSELRTVYNNSPENFIASFQEGKIPKDLNDYFIKKGYVKSDDVKDIKVDVKVKGDDVDVAQ